MRYKYNKEFLDDAIEMYGADIVQEVIDMVELSDPDGAYTIYEDNDMVPHIECVELLYYNL